MAVSLEEAFNSFAGSTEMDGRVSVMDGRAFVKCLKDAGFLDKAMTTVDADLIFAKNKPKGGRKINFLAFEDALQAVAKKKKMPFSKIIEMVCAVKGPNYDSGVTQSPTGFGPERFFYDESTYTGIHKTNSTAAHDGYHDFSALINRSHAQDDPLARRRKVGGDERYTPRIPSPHGPRAQRRQRSQTPEGQRTQRRQRSQTPEGQQAQRRQRSLTPESPQTLQKERPTSPRVVLAQRTFPTSHVGHVQPSLIPRPARIWQAPLTPERQWAQSLRYEGSSQVMFAEPVQSSLLLTPERPQVQQKENMLFTPPPRGPERFFYDRSTYTGVYAKGGPSTVDGPPRVNLEFGPPPPTVQRAGPRPGIRTNPDFGPERFFYDKSTYTGVHIKGGPSTVDKVRVQDLSDVTRTGLASGRNFVVV